MKKIIALAASAAIILSVGYYVFLALGSNTTPLPENSTIYDPKTSLLTAVKEDGTVDFADSAFKAQFKYYSSAYVDAKNSISSNGYTIGGTTIGGPNNWSRYCAYKFSEDSDILSSKLVTSSGENRLVFTAEETGEYTILPYQIGDGGSLSLSVGGGLSAFGENSVDFKIFETRSNKTVFSATLDAETPTANIAKGDGGNITVFLCEGDEIYFTTTTTASWHDVNYNSITLQSNFKISYDTTQNYSESEVYEPSEYIRDFVDGNSTEPDFSAGIFRPDAAYYSTYYLPMGNISASETKVTVGGYGSESISNWSKYCSFSVSTNDDTRIVSNTVTGNNGSANRLVFIAPYSAYYDIVPRGLENGAESSVELNLGSLAEYFGTNTANFKVVNPQTEETYTNITLYAYDENGNSKLTGNISETKEIYLEKGEMLYFITSTSADWFDYSTDRTVRVDFDFEIFMSRKDILQKTYRRTILPNEFSLNADILTYQTKYLGSAFLATNTTRDLGTYYLLGNNQNMNWDKYASFEIADNDKNTVITRLANKNCGAKIIFKAPGKGKYTFGEDKTVTLELGNYADRFSDNDNVKLIITKTSASTDSTLQEIILTKANPTANLSSAFDDMELEKNDTVTFTYSTTAEWFEEAEYQTISVCLDMKIDAKISTSDYTTLAVYKPGDILRSATAKLPAANTPLTTDAYVADYGDCVFRPENQYYSFNNTTQYGCYISGVLNTYGYTYENGSEGRSNQLLRGSFQVGGEHENAIIATIGKAGEDCRQKLTFIAPEAGWYAFNPIAFSASESGFIKNFNKNSNSAAAKVKITSYSEDIYQSEELGYGEAETQTYSNLFYLIEGSSVDIVFEAVDTTWNTDLRLGINFNISRVELN